MTTPTRWDPTVCSWPPGAFSLQIYGGQPEQLVAVNPGAIAFDYASGLKVILDDSIVGVRVLLIAATPQQPGGVDVLDQAWAGRKNFTDGLDAVQGSTASGGTRGQFSLGTAGLGDFPALGVDLQSAEPFFWRQRLTWGWLQDTGAGLTGLLILSGTGVSSVSAFGPPAFQSYAVTDGADGVHIGDWKTFTDGLGGTWKFSGGLFESYAAGSGGGGGGGTISIGDFVSGGTPHELLLVDGGFNLAQLPSGAGWLHNNGSGLYSWSDPGGGLTIGNPVAGSTAPGVLIVDASGNLAEVLPNAAGDLVNDGSGGLSWQQRGPALDSVLSLISLGL